MLTDLFVIYPYTDEVWMHRFQTENQYIVPSIFTHPSVITQPQPRGGGKTKFVMRYS